MGQAVVKRVVTTILWGDNPICAALTARGRPLEACVLSASGVHDFPSDTQEWDVLILPDDSCQYEWQGFHGDGQLLWLQHQGSNYLKDQGLWLDGRFPKLAMAKPAGFSHDFSGRTDYLNHVAALITSAGAVPDEYERAVSAFDAAVLRSDTSERAVRFLYSAAVVLWDLSSPDVRAAAAVSAQQESRTLAQRVPVAVREWRTLNSALGDVSAKEGHLDSNDRSKLEKGYRDVQRLLTQHLTAQ